MEEQLVRLLAETQSPAEGTRKQAELELRHFYNNEAFPIALVSIASHESVPINIRQSSLLCLKNLVLHTWSPQFEEFQGQVLLSHEIKARLRSSLLELATSGAGERKIKSAASYVVSKIASADFPDEWQDLLPTLLHIIPTGSDAQLHGALKVLRELVDDCFNDEQFFRVARDLVKVVYDVAVNDKRKPTLRALAVSVFRGCFDILEMVLEDHKVAVKGFAEEALSVWIPFFIDVMKTKLPPPLSDEDETRDPANAETYRGLVALKLQVVKVLMRIRSVFASLLAPHSPVLFSATWEELSTLQGAFHQMYIEGDRQGRLEDADNLPYSLDFLVLEELDFMQACLRAPPVRKELEQQLKNAASSENTWVTEVMKLAVAYAQIPTEEEGLWNIDVNIFLSEETSVTANYTSRTACGDLVIKLGEWLQGPTIEGLLSYTRTLYSTNQSWKAKEAALYILNQLLSDYQDVEREIGTEAANGFIDFIRFAMQQQDDFLRARGYLVAGTLTRTSGEALKGVTPQFMEASLQAITHDQSDVVKVSCIRALQCYLQALPHAVTQGMQEAIIDALSKYLNLQDMNEFAECDDLMVTLIETLRDAILLNTHICLTGPGLDLLFTIARYGASNFQLTMLVNETFEEITSTISTMGSEAYVRLCEKVLPSLTGAFDVGTLTEENSLTTLAAELLSTLAEHGCEPLPQGFVAATMPKLNRLLLGSSDEELLKAATSAVKNMLMHDYKQLFEWHDDTGKGGLEVVLIIIDRLLNPSVDDNAAAEVGALAAEVVEKAGSERLGAYMVPLLSAVAARLGTAEKAQFIQSLTLVFARLCNNTPQEVVDFLAQTRIRDESALQVVMSKWLENSITFAGYDEIRQNVIALSKLYSLSDPRLAQVIVKGDLIVPKSDRIMTRSRARQSKSPFSSYPGGLAMAMGYAYPTPSGRAYPSPPYSPTVQYNSQYATTDPDQYTLIPAPLKILKVLVEELAAGGEPRAISSAMADELAEEGSDDADWEDEPDTLDLTLGTTKNELMRYAESDGASFRQRDDETTAYLVQFFREAAQKPGFAEAFTALTSDEQDRLRSMIQTSHL